MNRQTRCTGRAKRASNGKLGVDEFIAFISAAGLNAAIACDSFSRVPTKPKDHLRPRSIIPMFAR